MTETTKTARGLLMSLETANEVVAYLNSERENDWTFSAERFGEYAAIAVFDENQKLLGYL